MVAGEWSDFQLYANCKVHKAHCALCPATAAVVASRPEFNTSICGAHFFSRMLPGTHLGAHCGPSNLRLRVHLGLVVPPGTRLRVGHEEREWVEGECLVFDDSFEHEVWHDGDSERIVLICDMWHPQLSLERDVLPTLLPDERATLHAAATGAHLPLGEQRVYSTGTTVAR